MKKLVALIFAVMLAFGSVATSYAVDSPVADIYTDVDSDGGSGDPESPKTGTIAAGLILASSVVFSAGCIKAVNKKKGK